MFNDDSLTFLQRTCYIQEELGMLTHLHSAQNRCSEWLDYFGYHALNLLGNSLCYTRLIPGVYHSPCKITLGWMTKVSLLGKSFGRAGINER